MPKQVFAEDVTPDLVEAYRRKEAEYLASAPKRFQRKWRCNRDNCDGKPHDGWEFRHARTQQLIPRAWKYTEIGGDEAISSRIAYLVGGRGSGKTWAGAHNFAQLVVETEPEDGDDHTEWGVIAPTYRSARRVCIEGPSGLIMALGGFERRGGLVEKWNRSDGELVLTTGAIVYIDGASDGAERIQGENLYGAWCDEIGLWKTWKRAWEESLSFAVRRGPARIICTGTPKLSSLAKYLLDDPRVWRRRLRTVDNLDNLAESAVNDLLNRYQGTRLGQQELEGLLVDDVEGALWRRANIDEDRVHEHVILEGSNAGDVYWERANGTQFRPPPFWLRVIVALDPADGEEYGDEQGIAVVAQSADDHELYVLHSDGLKVNPFDFLSEAVDQAMAFKNAHIPSSVEIVMEKNHGGKYLLGLMDQVLKHKGVNVAYRAVDANASTGGKRTRAEDVSGMYERHMVHHVGTLADLEDQMCLVGSTMVTTDSGPVPIGSVTTDDRVLTRAGWKRVLWSGQTGYADDLVKIRTGLRSIVCTPHHPVYVTGSGYVPARCVRPDRVLSTATSGTTSPPSAESPTGARHVRVVESSFIGSSGQRRTAANPQKAGTSTIRTKTRSIGNRTTSWFSRLGLTRGSTGRQVSPPSPADSALQDAERSGRNANPVRLCVLSAVPDSSQLDSAPSTAPLGVTSVNAVAADRVPVYNLTVEDQPEFFANGILVHNCTWTGRGSEPSPDRMDALVWALKQFVTGHLGSSEVVDTSERVVQWADATGIASDVKIPRAPSKGVRDIPEVIW